MKQKALSATLWSGADIFLRQGLQFVVSIILARLLSPEEFGIIALLYLFTGLASIFVDSGFSAALIQKQDITHDDESTVFWFNLAMGALTGIILVLLGPAIAAFYQQPVLVLLINLMALNILVTALGSVHGTLLTKHLDFSSQMKIGAIASVLSGIVAIVMARHGYGIWALAVQTLLASVLNTLLLWYYNAWRPTFVFSIVSAKRLFSYGGFLMFAGMMDVIYSRVYTMLIGKFYGVRELAFYNRADNTKQFPVAILSSILTRVAFPIFSAASGDKNLLRRGVQFAIRGMMLVNIPVMLGLAVVSEQAIQSLFGDNWTAAAPLMQILCVGALFWPLHVINLSVLTAQGHSHLFLYLQVIKNLLGVVFLIVGSFYGVVGIAWSQVFYSIVAFPVNAYYTKRDLDYGVVAQFRDVIPVFLITVPMILVVYFLGEMIHFSPMIELIIMSITGGVIFLGLGWLFKLRALDDALDLIKRMMPNRSISSKAEHL